MSKLEITYVHGFRSKFDTSKPKMQALSKLGHISGPQIDYEKDTLAEIDDKVCAVRPIGDLIVGTSMGAWVAMHYGIKYGFPFVAINPVIDPRVVWSIRDHIKDVADYYPFITSGERCGLVLLDSNDELLNSKDTFEKLKRHYHTEVFQGGSHRFDHMSESLEIINSFINNETVCYGL